MYRMKSITAGENSCWRNFAKHNIGEMKISTRNIRLGWETG